LDKFVKRPPGYKKDRNTDTHKFKTINNEKKTGYFNVV